MKSHGMLCFVFGALVGGTATWYGKELLARHVASTNTPTTKNVMSAPSEPTANRPHKSDAPGSLPEVQVWRSSSLRFPVNLSHSARDRYRELQLYYSTDHGKSWRLQSKTDVQAQYFKVNDLTDGEYWFVVCVVTSDGRREPSTFKDITPHQRIRVETALADDTRKTLRR